MKRWFRGFFAGHYRGSAVPAAGPVRYPTQEHFRIEVYQALVTELRIVADELEQSASPREFEVSAERTASLEGAPMDPESTASEGLPRMHHHEPQGPTLSQPHIGQVHLVDAAGPGRTIRTTAYDVLMSSLSLSHPARTDRHTLGRIEGEISGWFRPPPEPEPVREVAAQPSPAPVGWSTDIISWAAPGSQAQTLASGDAGTRPSAERPSGRNDVRVMEAFRWLGDENTPPPSTAPRSPEQAVGADEPTDPDPRGEAWDDDAPGEDEDPPLPPTEYPFFAAGVTVLVALLFLARAGASVVWASTFLPAYGLRRWLLGVVPDVVGVRVLSLVMGAGPPLVAALLLARWTSSGCVSLPVGPLLFVVLASFATSLLPRPLPFALASGSLGLVLLSAYGRWAPELCH